MKALLTRLLSCRACVMWVRKLITCAENSSSLGKSTEMVERITKWSCHQFLQIWGWRSKKSKVQKNVGNSSTNEQSIIISCKSILIINRVLLPAWLIRFARWNLFALQVHKSNNYNVKFALLQSPINGFKTRWHAFCSLS